MDLNFVKLEALCLPGYASTYKGETETGAWEIASGCRHYWVAFLLDITVVMTGLLFNPIE